MARAYAYAEGDGPEPWELRQLRAIDRFGAQSVAGRPLSVGEIQRMTVVQDIVRAYQLRAKADSWADWASKNPALSGLLNRAMLLAEGDDA